MSGRRRTWRSGDLVVMDGIRWVIRAITSTTVELEAMNTVTAMWRRIPPSQLP